jgi:hypothetical protein
MKVTPSPFYIVSPRDQNSSRLSPNYAKYVVKDVKTLTSEANQQSDLTPDSTIYLPKDFPKNSQLPPEEPKKSVIEGLETIAKGAAISGSVVTVGIYPGLSGSEDQIIHALTETFSQFSIPLEFAKSIAHSASSASKSHIGQAVVIALSGGILYVAVLEAVNPKISPLQSISAGLAVAMIILIVLFVLSSLGIFRSSNQQPSTPTQNSPGNIKP